jgi:hypothetical protein
MDPPRGRFGREAGDIDEVVTATLDPPTHGIVQRDQRVGVDFETIPVVMAEQVLDQFPDGMAAEVRGEIADPQAVPPTRRVVEPARRLKPEFQTG